MREWLKKKLEKIIEFASRGWGQFKEWREERRVRRAQALAASPPPPPAPPGPPDGGMAPPRSDPPETPQNRGLYQFLQLIGLVVSFGLVAWGILDWNGILFTAAGLPFNVGPLPIAAGLAYFGYSWAYGVVDERKIAGVYTYGYALVNLSPGPHFIPIGIMQIVRFDRGVQKIQVPTDNPDLVFHGPDKDPLPPGMVRTLRILTGGPDSASIAPQDADPLDSRMMLEANYVVQFRITNVLDFVANYVSLDLLEQQVRDVGDPTLAEEFSKKTPAKISRTLGEVNERLSACIERRFAHSGADFISTRVSIDPGLTVSEGLAKVPVARADAQANVLRAEGDRQAVVLRAEGEKQATIKRGEGEGEADKARFTGRGEGMKKIMESLQVSGESVLAAETARDLAETINDKADTLVIGAQGGLGDIIGVTKAVQTALTSQK